MNKNKIVLGEQETPVLSLRKKLVGLDDGLYVYSTLSTAVPDPAVHVKDFLAQLWNLSGGLAP